MLFYVDTSWAVRPSTMSFICQFDVCIDYTEMTKIIEVHNTVRAPEVGTCIYCGAKEHLTDEHIVPLALGGAFVLPDASCQTCASITSKFERKVLRGFMFDARTAGRYPTRHKKKTTENTPSTSHA